jgi:hypothetical protein
MNREVKTGLQSGTEGQNNEGNASQVDSTANGGKSQSDSSGSANAGGEQSGSGDNDRELDVSKLDPKIQKLIKDLRSENANSRQKNKSLAESHGKLKSALVEAGIIENDEEAPEEKLKKVSAQNEVATFQNAILETAIEHGVGKEDLKFYRFLVQERIAELGDDEELSAEELAVLASQAKSRRGGQTSNSTSVGQGSNGGTPPAPGGQGTITVEKFAKMNIGEKTEIYLKNKDLYSQLMAEAKAKKMLV